MTAFNVVRFRTKPGMEQAFIDAHRKIGASLKGMRKFTLIRTGDSAFCAIGEWSKFESIAAARPAMIGLLDSFRSMLEDLGGGLGVTDPVSGSAVVEVQARKRAKAKPRAKKRAKKKRRAR